MSARIHSCTCCPPSVNAALGSFGLELKYSQAFHTRTTTCTQLSQLEHTNKHVVAQGTRFKAPPTNRFNTHCGSGSRHSCNCVQMLTHRLPSAGNLASSMLVRKSNTHVYTHTPTTHPQHTHYHLQGGVVVAVVTQVTLSPLQVSIFLLEVEFDCCVYVCMFVCAPVCYRHIYIEFVCGQQVHLRQCVSSSCCRSPLCYTVHLLKGIHIVLVCVRVLCVCLPELFVRFCY